MEKLPDHCVDLVSQSSPTIYNSWERNVIDEYKSLSDDEIRSRVEAARLPYSILMTHVARDYNLGNVLRIGNCLGAKVYYYGKRRWDKRSAVGVWNYSPITHLASIAEVKALKAKYRFVALEQSDSATPLPKYNWTTSKPSLIVVGEESQGLQSCPEIFELADDFVQIQQLGSVRSLNVSAACAIAAYDFITKTQQGK